MAETRKVIDCRRFPAEKPCSIVISGTEDDVLDLAVLQPCMATRTRLNCASRSAPCSKMRTPSQPKPHNETQPKGVFCTPFSFHLCGH